MKYIKLSSAEYNNIDLLKSLPFYASKLHSSSMKKDSNRKQKISNVELSHALPFHPKKTKKIKKISNVELSHALPFHSKKIKKIKRKKILTNVLPFYEEILIHKRERAFKGAAETYHVEVHNRTSFRDSLYLPKNSIINFLKEKL